MVRYIIGRIIALIPVVLVAAIIVFAVVHMIPGDPARVMLGMSASDEQVEQLREQLRLNDPLVVQFFTWLGSVLQGDLGTSVFSKKPVLDLIMERVGPTVSLAVFSTLLSIFISIPFAMLAVWKRDSLLDPTFMSITLFGVSIPNFWFALLLMLLFSVTLGWLPIAGYIPLKTGNVLGWLSCLILPTIVLSVQQAGLIARMMRDGMLDVIGQDYIRTARSKGLTEKAVFLVHAFRNAMIPTTTTIGASFAGLLGGAVVTETVFAIPGLGRLIVDAISSRDYPVLQGTVLFIAAVYVIVNLIIDLIYAFLDPRIRYD